MKKLIKKYANGRIFYYIRGLLIPYTAFLTVTYSLKDFETLNSILCLERKRNF